MLPFLLAAKCTDPNNPGEKEARKADRECRAAYKERLLERVAIIQKRLEAENDDLLRRQQAFSRNRDHTEGAEEEFEKYVTLRPCPMPHRVRLAECAQYLYAYCVCVCVIMRVVQVLR